MNKLRRTARTAAFALALVVISAAPASAATPPTRTVSGLSDFVHAAGSGCAFDVAGEPDGGFVAETDFSDGSVLLSVRARGAYVNLETNARYQTLDTYRDFGRYDPATGIQVGVEAGQMTWNFLTGDIGPYGLVTNPDGAYYHFIGTVSYTFDANTGHSTAFAFTGTVEDVCAALS